MPKNGAPRDLSVEELRRLLVEKRRSMRQERLEHYRRTGRVVMLASDEESASLDQLHSRSEADEEEQDQEKTARSRPKRILDGGLLFVEIAAVLGLFFVLFNGLEIIRNLNQQAVEAFMQPTLTPTPLIVAVVLPSGHTPPDAKNGTRPNEAEIPEHLRPLVQSLANIPVPTEGPVTARRIQVPAIKVEAPVVQGDGWEQLKKGVGQHNGSANPGDQNNVVLSAHNDVFGEIFRDLDRLKPGDTIVLYTSQRSYTYIVTGTAIVEPTQVDVMAPSNQAIVTLISCYPYMIDNKRIVVTALLQK